jgi:SNW domain-containing protein 1
MKEVINHDQMHRATILLLLNELFKWFRLKSIPYPIPWHHSSISPRGPAEDPVSVLHAPPTKLSKEETTRGMECSCVYFQLENTRGYTIPVNKRLAADGSGLREDTINPNFATLLESSYVAVDRHDKKFV